MPWTPLQAVSPVHGGAAFLVHVDAAHEIVLGRGDGDAFARHVVALFQALGVDMGEMGLDGLLAQGAQVLPDEFGAVLFHLRPDGRRQQVPGHQLVGEALHLGIVEQRARAFSCRAWWGGSGHS